MPATSWLLISGDFTPLGGMDRANHALASYLAAQGGAEVHLVGHRMWPDLCAHPAITTHRVVRPLSSHFLGAPLLAAAGERRARRLRHARVVANGGNADTGDVAWVHYVHAAYTPAVAGTRAAAARAAVAHRYYAGRERRALRRASLVVCNSRRTAREVVERVGIPESRVRTVYYGTDRSQLSRVTPAERQSARRTLGVPAERRVALFVGALGDRRKGFDRLISAWTRLCADPAWDVQLVVAGAGGELQTWRERAARLGDRVRFLGFREDVPTLLAASDFLVHPSRYEPYGLGVHEAICRGLPAIVTASAGIAERYPEAARDLLLDDAEDVDALCGLLRRCAADVEGYASRLAPFADTLRARSWQDMSREIVEAACP